MNNCCEDIFDIGCYRKFRENYSHACAFRMVMCFNVAGDCREAGHGSCCEPTGHLTFCRIQTGPHTECSCSDMCRGSNDCCADIDIICSLSNSGRCV